MCKNADKPCPGCKKNEKADATWMFFTKEERQAAEKEQKASRLAKSRS